MQNICDIATTMVKNFSPAYFLIALPVAIVCGLLWFAIRRLIHSPHWRRALLSLLLAVTFAPSLLGFDLGVITVPAHYVIYIELKGGVYRVAAYWSAVSIFGFWAMIFGVWSLIALYHDRAKQESA